jgi:hypothetical protein
MAVGNKLLQNVWKCHLMAAVAYLTTAKTYMPKMFNAWITGANVIKFYVHNLWL